MDLIVHICLPLIWQEAEHNGEYRGDTLDTQGFIHCSKPEQVLKVANAYYSNQQDLLLTWIDPQKLEPELRWEAADEDVFPHIYGPLNLNAVVGKTRLLPNSHGWFEEIIYPKSSTR